MRALVRVAITIAVCAAEPTRCCRPATVSIMIPSGRIRATWDAKAGTRVEDVKRHKVLWSILDSHRSLLVADDGKHLVERYDGLNLLPTDFSDDLVLLTFCAKEKNFAMSESEISCRTTTFWGRLLRTIIGAR